MLYSVKSGKMPPRYSVPLFSFSMEKLNICFSTSVEKKFLDKVEMMRGKVSTTVSDQVTHFVTNKVGSAEFHVTNF